MGNFNIHGLLQEVITIQIKQVEFWSISHCLWQLYFIVFTNKESANTKPLLLGEYIHTLGFLEAPANAGNEGSMPG